MKLSIAISLIAHLVVIGVLNLRAPTHASANVAVAVLDRVPGVAPPSPELPISPRPIVHTPPPRARRVARMVPIAPPPPPAPTPEPTPDPVEESALPPEPEMAAPEQGAEAPATGNAAGAAARPDLHRDPDMDPSSCTRGLEYPADVMRLDKEVVVRLRVAIDDKGKVRDAKVIERAGERFEETALEAVRRHCRFTAALDDRGRPVPFVIDDYRFHIRPADFQAPTTGHFILQN